MACITTNQSLQIIHEIFSEPPVISNAVCKTIQSYIPPQDLALIDLFLGRLPAWINLADQETLRLFLAKNLTHPHALNYFHDISSRIYESPRRLCCDNSGGVVYPMYPESLALAMRFSVGENVLELGAASGENGILLTFSGAMRVYVNELSTRENEIFKQYHKQIPQEVAKKLELVPGDCLKLLQLKPELKQNIGFVICRNLIHFFTSQQQAIFFNIVKKVLKSGARGVFTANSPYQFSNLQEVLRLNPECTTFKYTVCNLTDLNQGTAPTYTICSEFEPCSDELISTKYEKFCLYERRTGEPWKVYNDTFNKIDETVRPKIKKACKENTDKIKPIKRGTVCVIVSHIRLYETATLAALFRKQGFHVEHTFATALNGHLIHQENLWETTHQIGVVVRKT